MTATGTTTRHVINGELVPRSSHWAQVAGKGAPEAPRSCSVTHRTRGHTNTEIFAQSRSPRVKSRRFATGTLSVPGNGTRVSAKNAENVFPARDADRPNPVQAAPSSCQNMLIRTRSSCHSPRLPAPLSETRAEALAADAVESSVRSKFRVRVRTRTGATRHLRAELLLLLLLLHVIQQTRSLRSELSLGPLLFFFVFVF